MTKFAEIQNREKGLKQNLEAKQLSMIALGGAIGTGLFLGSKFAIGFAGPSVVISYAIAGLLALTLMAALSEMTVHHSTSGSFGVYAEHYLSPIWGFIVRYMYWLCMVLVVGTEVIALGEYMKMWFPTVPAIVWMIGFSVLLIAINAGNVKNFGTLEYWFSAIKVFAIIAFILVAAYIIFFNRNEEQGFQNWGNEGGFMPGGIWGTWVAVIVAVFSYFSIEMIAVAAGEAKEPQKAVKKAFKTTIARLIIFYILTLALIVTLSPTSKIIAPETSSPFVTVLQQLGIPLAGSIFNLVLITAALSAMNSQLYISTRMIFSLARSGDAPKRLGNLNSYGAPVNALLLSSIGIAVAVLVHQLTGGDAYTTMIGIAMFGAMLAWVVIFITHAVFRARLAAAGEQPAYRIPGSRIGAMLGLVLMLAVMVTTLFTPEFFWTLPVGLTSTAICAVAFLLTKRRRAASSENN